MRTYTAEQIAQGVTFAWAYQRKLRQYLGRPYLQSFGARGPSPSHSGFGHCVRAAELAECLNISFEDYIEAHFWDAQRSRGRHPQPRFLHKYTGPGPTSAEKVASWLRARAQGAQAHVLAEGRRERGTKKERLATQERYLRQLGQQWSASPEDILRALGGPEAGVFDPAWLATQPTWLALLASGHFADNPGPDLAYLRRCRARASEPR